MTKKRIRQMNAALLRRMSLRPAAEYLAGREETAAQLVGDGYFQRFAPLMDRRLCCARVLDLCREDLERLDGPEPEEGWLPYCYDFARRLLFPEKDARPAHGAGAVFFLSVLQVLLDAERELLDYDPAWDFVPPGPEELEDCPAAPQFGQMMRLWRREFVYEMMRLGLEVTPYRTLEHIVGVHHVAVTAGRALRRGTADLPNVDVVPGGDYIISRATFPAYFLQGDPEQARCDLELTLFGKRIAPALGITRRFVGQQPYSPVTARYNQRMQALLPQWGIRVEEIPRLEGISASRVRQLLRQGRLAELQPLVPETTYAYCRDHFGTGAPCP